MRQLEEFGRSMSGWTNPAGAASADGVAIGAQPRAPAAGSGLIVDDRLNAVLARLRHEALNRPSDGGPRHSGNRDPFQYADHGFSISSQQGELIYFLCRTLRATRVVEFASSVGVSTLYFAAAMRDNGGGTVIGSEMVPQKIQIARQNLKEAGLDNWVELREGDARQTLQDLGGAVDLALIDGWPAEHGPSLARQVLELIAAQIRRGGIVMNDNAEADYLSYVRDPKNGFISISLPLKGATELSLKL